ncbi:alpha-amylase family glycosyl hydrolase [Salinimicrobium xinjiangense]|uniref:alpha-amylase family glycosyl hydrolase n=1 Tax=Salinimicrobium xinjiangense TaxID=438596 RepID=UPI00040F4E63|nr:alpha-amylase family glycosyl hydrolase [Salinimicrobium xinjiangense]
MNLNKIKYSLVLLFPFLLSACKYELQPGSREIPENQEFQGKAVVYQIFTRLYGNTNTTNKAWGTIEENGAGKFSDFSEKALGEIKDLGVTHIWYTGVPQHAVIRDYTAYGISNDDPDVVKGRAGSPYAVKNYYSVKPDLADDPARRVKEFEELIARTHKAGMKVLIDIVPNHVARKYEELDKPEGVETLGVNDDQSVTYKVNNNFYYNPGEAFQVPEWRDGYQPLGGEDRPLVDGKFDEFPAKWTGNGARESQPDMHDWYETVKINYGVTPDGKREFPELPAGFEDRDYKAHFEFWSDKTVPDSWNRFRDITLYWIEKGVDGFRFDMAEMVPVEFWSYLNSAIKTKNPNAFLLAEVYQPHLYRDYLKKGKMDCLYDKVQLYDTIKNVMQGRGSTDNIPPIQEELKDIEHHMLHFLENHDEQRIASPEFAGSAAKGKPAMVVSATISTSPTLIYFGQEVGEPGAEDAGFGKPSRTSIFDYVGVPAHQRWMNDKQFDGGQSTSEEKELRDFYKRLLNFTINSSALMGEYRDLHEHNRQNTTNYSDKVLAYTRWSADEKLIIVSNFEENSQEFELMVPQEVIALLGLEDGNYTLVDQLYNDHITQLKVKKGTGRVEINLEPLQSLILKIN